MNWEELPLQDRATILADAAMHGVFGRENVKEFYAQQQILKQKEEEQRAQIMDYVDRRFPATMVLDYVPYRDNGFRPKEIGDYGNIEYIPKNLDRLNYCGYDKPKDFSGRSVIVFNDDNYDTNEAVALDAVSHGLREQDEYWRTHILPKLERAWINADPGQFAYQFYQIDKAQNGSDAEPFSSHYRRQVDAAIRNLLVDTDNPEVQGYEPESNQWLLETDDMKQAWQEAYDYIMNKDGHILPELEVTPNIFDGGGRKERKRRRTRPSPYNQETFTADYNTAWSGTRYDTPEWRSFWTKLAQIESSFDPQIMNELGAKGYFQLMPFNRAEVWSDNIQQFSDADKTISAMEGQLTEDDLRRGAELGYDKYALLAGAWLGGIGGMRDALNGINRADMNGATVLDRMNAFMGTDAPTPSIKTELVMPQVPSYEDFKRKYDVAQADGRTVQLNDTPVTWQTDYSPRSLDIMALLGQSQSQSQTQTPEPPTSARKSSFNRGFTLYRTPSRRHTTEFSNSQLSHFFDNGGEKQSSGLLSIVDATLKKVLPHEVSSVDTETTGQGIGYDYGTSQNPISLKELLIPVTPEMRALAVMQGRLNRDKPLNDYYQAQDMSYPRKLLTSVTDKGVSNCTLNATSAYGPEYTFASARNVIASPLFMQVTGDEVVPGTMLIQSLPDTEDGDKNKYHSAIFSGTADRPYVNQFGDRIQTGDSLYIYSTGKDEPGAMRQRPKAALMDNHGKTRFRYFRPNAVE